MDQHDKLYFWLPLVIIAALAVSITFSILHKNEIESYDATSVSF
jgi:hypothetical protein